jgi:hypothetical protein
LDGLFAVSNHLMLVVLGCVATFVLLEMEDLVFCLLDDDIEPDAEVRGYDVHHSKTSHNDVAVLDNLNLE